MVLAGSVEYFTVCAIDDNVIFAIRMSKSTSLLASNNGKITSVNVGTAKTPLNQPDIAIETDSSGDITIVMSLINPTTTTFVLVTSPTYSGRHFYHDTDSPLTFTIHPS